MKKYLPSILLLFFLYGCLAPDRDQQSLELHPETIKQDELSVIKVFDISDNELDGAIYLLRSDSHFVDMLMSNFVVDNSNSALIHLSKNYILALVIIENKTNEPKIFLKKNLNLGWEDRNLIPLTSNDYPKEIRCFNWKGTAKNFYNFIAISVVTVYTVNAMLGCLEGKCEAMRYLEKELNENHPSKKGSYFSDLNFTTTLDFNEKVDLDGFLIKPGTLAKGIVLYRDPKPFANIKDYLTKGNCVIN